MKGKLIIFSAPSGSGKTTIVKYLLSQGLNLAFSVSATSREKRAGEENGKDYYFLTADDFRKRRDNGDFLEWEEVYTDKFYGTLRSEVERLTAAGHNVIFDVDVIGGRNIKTEYGERALSIFIAPPSIEELHRRLVGRGTDSPEVIAYRVKRADFEMTFRESADVVIVNDDLEKAKAETLAVVKDFIDVDLVI